MLREPLPISLLSLWSDLNNVEFNNVVVSASETERGVGIWASGDSVAESPNLVRVPRELVLSVQTIWEFAKSDHQLHSILAALGDFTKTARGAILIFLLVQITSSSSDVTVKIGNAHPWTEYVRFLPTDFTLPTFWTDAERELLEGTSLAAALEFKMGAIQREFDNLRSSTADLDCCKVWWDRDIGRLTIYDYLQVDALYRSRAMELPGTGLALVPCIDMANHGSGEEINALYETDANGSAVLILANDKTPQKKEELLISYGEEKGACEMLFSYGFMDIQMKDARTLFLELGIPDDDPLKFAKMEAFDVPPGFRISMENREIAWHGPCIWLQCVNEEDGLGFHVLQQYGGPKELKVSWRGKEIEGILTLQQCIEEDRMSDIFRLRAFVVMTQRIRDQLSKNEVAQTVLADLKPEEYSGRPEIKDLVQRLGSLEARLLHQALRQFDKTILELMNTETVKMYLNPDFVSEPILPKNNSVSVTDDPSLPRPERSLPSSQS